MLLGVKVLASDKPIYFVSPVLENNEANSYHVYPNQENHCMLKNRMDDIHFTWKQGRSVPHPVAYMHYSSAIFGCGWHQSYQDFAIEDSEGHKAEVRWYRPAIGANRIWIRSDPDNLINYAEVDFGIDTYIYLGY